MAGSGAKIIYPRNTNTHLKALHNVEYRTAYSNNNLKSDMEEDVIDQLHSPNLSRQLQALDDLRLAARRNGGSFPYHRQKVIFDALSYALADHKQDIRLQCTQLIHELIPQYGDNLDDCMSYVVPKLVPNLGDSTIAIRRATIQTLHVYMKYTPNLPQLFQAIVQHGLDHQNPRVKKEVIIALPMLFTPEFSQEDFFHVAQSLAKKLLDSNLGEEKVKEHILLSLEKIRNLVGNPVYDGYIQRLSAPLRKYYLKLTNNNDFQNDKNMSHGYSGHSSSSQSSNQVSPVHSAFEHIPSSADKQFYKPKKVLEYGIAPSHVMEKLNDQTNYRTRAQAVEELKGILHDLGRSGVEALNPHVSDFISYLNNLLDDSNFKITTVTLEILGILVDKFGTGIRPHLKPMMACLTKRMGDNKIVIRQAIMKVVMQLMQILLPKPVLSAITDNLSNRNSRTRQETLNIIIASLLTFPSYDFDLSVLCTSIAHTLVDPKRQVRQAALECFAVIAQAMGAGKLQPLVQAVDSAELSYEGDGVMAAVQARLTRRQLPKLNSDGLVDYATPIPSSGTVRGGSTVVTGPDIEWILLGAGSSGNSARSRDSTMELESLASSSARSTPSTFSQSSPSGSTPRRHPSAGRNRSKLPWEDEMEGLSTSTDEGSPMKPKATWGGEEAFNNDMKKFIKKKSSENRHTFRTDSPEHGSYQRIHRNKYQRQSSDGSAAAHYNVFDSPSNSDIDSPSSAPFVPDWGEYSDENKDNSDNSPIPTKPTLARGVSSKRKVPPIPIDNSYRDDEMIDSARDSVLDDNGDDDDESEMRPSLSKIRNSASKKKVEKIFQKQSPPSSNSNSSRDGTQELSPSKSHHDDINKGKKPEAPFETKARIVRKSNPPSPKREHVPLSSNSQTNIANQDVKAHSEFKPHGGVTFQKKSSLEVELVGHGYNEDVQTKDSRPNQVPKPKDRKKSINNTKSVLSPLGMASQTSYGQIELDDDRLPGGVIGKGMFEPNSQPSDQSSGNGGNKRLSQSESDRNLMRGVYGVQVRSSSQDDSDEDAMDDVDSISLGKTTKEHLRQKQEEAERKQETAKYEYKQNERALRIKKNEEKKKQEQEKTRREKERQEQERIRREKERQQEKLRRLSTQTDEGLTISGSSQPGPPSPQDSNSLTSLNGSGKKSPTKATPKRKTKPSPTAADPPSHPGTAKSGEPELTSDLKPFNDPHIAYTEAMKMVTNEEWEMKCTGINHIRRLAVHHPDVILQNLHTVNVAIINEVKNLRSQVSRLAIICLGDMYTYLRRNMDLDLDQTSKALLAKNGESNGFIRSDIDQTVSAMVENVTPQRAIAALIAGGTSHKNIAVRKLASYHLMNVAEILGPGRVLSGIKDLTDRILNTATQFLSDPKLEVRYNGQRILYNLMSHEDFDRQMNKFVAAPTLRAAQDKLDSLRKKGLGDPPAESSSARTGRSTQGSKIMSNSRGNSATSDHTSQTSASSKRSGRTDEATMEEINIICGLMSANDWRDRQKGIQQLIDMTSNNQHIVGNNIVKIFDKFVPCLKDSNSKVNLCALQAINKLVPSLKDYFNSVVTITVPTVSSNLSSKNSEILRATASILDTFMEHLDPAVLLHPFANQAQMGTARVKPDMINRVAYLTNEVYYKKPKQVVLHVLPLLWHLLGTTPSSGAVPGGTGNLHSATGALVQTLQSCMGHGLLENAQSTSTVTQRMLQTLQDILDNP